MMCVLEQKNCHTCTHACQQQKGRRTHYSYKTTHAQLSCVGQSLVSALACTHTCGCATFPASAMQHASQQTATQISHARAFMLLDVILQVRCSGKILLNTKRHCLCYASFVHNATHTQNLQDEVHTTVLATYCVCMCSPSKIPHAPT